MRARLFHWRTSGEAGVDLLIEAGQNLVPIEIKLHSAPARGQVRGLSSCMSDLGLRKGYVVYPGDAWYSLGTGITAVPAAELLASTEHMASILGQA